jgi:5-methylthioribose kinase
VSWDYELLTTETVPTYVAGNPRLAGLVDPDTLHVEEVGDGNLNLVFVCRDAEGRGICLKQSLPYVRLVGESWPLTPHRATAEARGYDAAAAHAADFIPDWYGFDADRFILAMENLDHWVIWRTALNEGQIHPGVEVDMGRYVARLAFYTSIFTVEQKEMKSRLAASVNPELCEITEDLVFTEPYIDHEHNAWQPGVEPAVMALRNDERHIAEVNALKFQFMTAAEALIHGDLHTGSVMVTRDGDRGFGKAIDSEFCFYGPVGFDLGALFGNYLAAMARAAVLNRPSEFNDWVGGLVSRTWAAFEQEMRELWPDRTHTFLNDVFFEDWLARMLRDGAGFGGCKAIRRIIGLAKVSDIETLEGEAHVTAATAVLRAASRWIKERHSFTSPGDLEQIAREVIAEEVSR